MKLLFAFMFGLILCCQAASAEEKKKSYFDETEGWDKIHELYLGGDYFAFFFTSKHDDHTHRAYLVKCDGLNKEICCKLKYYVACALYPPLTEVKNYYLSPSSLNEGF